MKRCAFLTLDDPTPFVIDDPLVFEPMAELGWRVDSVSWRADVDWNDYEAVLIRTPWDYQDDPEAFVAVLEAVEASSARLENPLDLVRWNLRKTYLRDLEQRGVRIVPTLWGLAGEGCAPPDVATLRACFDAPELASEGGGGLIVKPVVSANADDTFRLPAGVPDDLLAEVARTFARDGSVRDFRDFMVQPFVESVVSEGEYSLFYFCDGTESDPFSHAILKTPKRDDFRVQEEHGGRITAMNVDAATRERILARGRQVMDAIRPAPLYARVDLVRLADGDFALMEVELIEPSLYFRMDPGAPERFARAFDSWMTCAAVAS